MIARVWRGATLAEHGDEYAAYLEESGMREARALPGCRGTLVLRRPRSGYVEFETILLFDKLEDVRSFAGDELEAAVFFELDDKYLVERELEVRHFEVDVQLEPVSTAR
jgi:antibiotic biosynthesis monooxygenase (ABM) superfamily enzyme